MELQGTLQEKPFLQVIREIGKQGLTGVLEVNVGRRIHEFFFKEGILLVLYIERSPLLSQEAIDMAQTEEQQRQLVLWLRARTADAIVHILAWRKGTYEFHRQPVYDDDFPYTMELLDTGSFIYKLTEDVKAWRAKKDLNFENDHLLVFPHGLKKEEWFGVDDKKAKGIFQPEITVRRALDRLSRQGLPRVRSYVLLQRWIDKGALEILPEEEIRRRDQQAREKKLQQTGAFTIALQHPVGDNPSALTPSLPFGEFDTLEDLLDALDEYPEADRLAPNFIAYLRKLLVVAVEEDDWDLIMRAVQLYLPDPAAERGADKRWKALAEVMQDIRDHASEYTFITIGERIGEHMIAHLAENPDRQADDLKQFMAIVLDLHFTPLVYQMAGEIQERLEQSPSEDRFAGFLDTLSTLKGVLKHQEYDRLRGSIVDQAGRHLAGKGPVLTDAMRTEWISLLLSLPGEEPQAVLQELLRQPSVARIAGPQLTEHHRTYVPGLLKELVATRSDEEARDLAISVGCFGAPAKEYVWPWLEKDDRRYREAALRIIGNAGTKDDLPRIEPFMDDPSLPVQNAAFEAKIAVHQGKERDILLLQALQEAPSGKRWQILDVMARYGGTGSAAFLHKQLESASPPLTEGQERLIVGCITTLARLGFPQSLAVSARTVEVYATSDHRDVTLAAMRATKSYYPRFPDKVSALWNEWTGHNAPVVSSTALGLLKEVGANRSGE